MFTNAIRLLIISFPLLIAQLANSQSLQTLQAQIRSMEACRQSIKHAECNLQILDKDIRDTLIQLDRLNQQRQSRQEVTSYRELSQGNVQFFTTSILEVNSEVLKMMGGSVWRLDRSYFGLPLQDAIGIMTDQRNATIYANDNSYTARLISGTVFTSMGSIRTVIEKMGDGSILKLDDGTLLEFSSYEKYYTGYWLTPYKVLIDAASANMWNLEKGKKVWIQKTLK